MKKGIFSPEKMDRPCHAHPNLNATADKLCDARWEDKFSGINPLGWAHLTKIFVVYLVGIGISVMAFMSEKVAKRAF